MIITIVQASIRDPNPVVFLENEILYGTVFEVPEAALDKDFTIPIGQAKVQREGKHITLVSYARGVHKCLEAAETLAKEGIQAEVTSF